MPETLTAARVLAQQLLTQGAAQRAPGAPPGQTAVWACEQLRAALTPFTGVAGFRSLLARALVLAQRDAPWLAPVAVTAEGGLVGVLDAAPAADPGAVAAGGTALLTHFFGLLHLFVGEPLTHRLLASSWPGPPFNPHPGVPQERTR
jgi:hypothetical protein